MAEKFPRPEAEELEEAQFEKPVFDYEAALNNKDFVEFLELYPESESLEFTEENKEELGKRWEVFENKQLLDKELPGLFKEEIEPAFGMKLGKEENKLLADYLEMEAIDDPERSAERVQELKAYRELRKEKEEMEKEIAALGGEENLDKAMLELARKREEVEKRKEIGKWSVGWRGFLNPKNSGLLGWAFRLPERAKEGGGPQELRKEMRKAVKSERAYFFEKTDEQIDSLRKSEEFLENYPTIKEATEAIFSNLRKEFFQNFEPAKGIFEEINDKIMTRMGEFMDPNKGLEFYEEAQKFEEKIEAAKERFDVEQLSNLPLDVFQTEIDKQIEMRVNSGIADAMDKFTVTDRPLDELRKELKKYLAKEKLGSKGKWQTKLYVVNVLREQIAKLNTKKPAGYKQRITLLKVVAGDLAYNG